MKKISKAVKPLCALFFFLFFSSLSNGQSNKLEASSSEAPLSPMTLEEVRLLLDRQIAEWDEMKPALKRLIKSEQDLSLIVAALDKIAPLAGKPNEQQLLDPKALTLPTKNTTVKLPPKYDTDLPSTGTTKDANIAKVKRITDMEKKQTSQVGIHLASYKKPSNAIRGWEILKEKYSDTLKNKTPLYYQVKVNQTTYTRLVAGDFLTENQALNTCKTLTSISQFCQKINYSIKKHP